MENSVFSLSHYFEECHSLLGAVYFETVHVLINDI